MAINTKGFSLVEILVSLIVVSLTAVNVVGLQKKVSQQQRNNLAHTAVLALATEKMEEALALATLTELTALHNTSETGLQIGNTAFTVQWKVTDISGLGTSVGNEFKKVNMEISWLDALGKTQYYTHSGQINLALLLSGASNVKIIDQLAGIIPSTLQTNEVIYFEPKMGYKKGSFVIYNSYLYKATSVHSVGNGHPRTVIDPETGIEEGSGGWHSYGRIDNPELANNPDLATLFLE